MDHSRRQALFRRIERYRLVSIVLIQLMVVSACYRSTTLERYIIDDDVRGTIVIAFGDRYGEPSVTELGVHIYTIPKGGLLFTRGKLMYGPVKDAYFLRDSVGTLRRIRYIQPWVWKRSFRDSNEIVVWQGLTTKFRDKHGKDVHVATFIVGAIRDADLLTERSDSIIVSYRDTILGRFRNQ